jgi:hypothetical protein
MGLSELFNARLSESGISAKDAKRAKLSPLRADATSKLWAGAPKQDALVIPYLDPKGRDTKFYRIRFLGELNGFAKQAEKPPRYLQPPKSGVHVYFPSVAGVDWMTVLADPKQSLIITEGELKALAATLEGFPTLGLGGVDSWRSGDEPFLRDLDAIVWDGRVVYVCYDSDATTKPQVSVSSQKLADELAKRGAQVFDAGLPSIGTAKVGLDDFLKLRGRKGLVEHLESVHEFSNTKPLHEFNERFVFVRSMAKIYEEKTHQFHSGYNFVHFVEANQTYTKYHVTEKGLKATKASVAADWLAWGNRREVDDLTYRPGNAERIVTEEGQTFLNFWKGWGVAPRAGNVAPFTELLEHLTENEPADIRAWLLKWLAYPLQNPGTKLLTAVVVWGSAQGTGKTLLGVTLNRIYGANGQMIGENQLASPYNPWIQRKQFIVGDEITGNDSRAYADRLKGLITGTTIRVNEKYQPEYDLPNCANFYFTSNHPDAFFIDDKDRRYLVIEAPSRALPQEFYDKYDAWLRGSGPAALFAHLLRIDVRGFNPNASAPRTMAHEVMSEVAQSEMGRFIACVIRDPEGAQRLWRVPPDVALFTAHELLQYYDPRGERKVSERAAAIELQKQGAAKVLGGTQVLCGNLGRLRLYAVRDMEKWKRASAAEVREAIRTRKLATAKF